jgi:glycosyltransferase involved in cell wall biosynthesis
MTIAYLANVRLPTEKAHGYQIMRVCAELAALGHSVTLYVPARRNPIAGDPFTYYGLVPTFPVVVVPCADWMRFVPLLGSLAFVLQTRSFARAAAKRVPREAVVYTRDPEVVDCLAPRGWACVYGAHNWRGGRAARLVSRARGVVCNSKGTEAAVRASLSLPTMVAYNAADPNPYVGADKRTLRAALGLPQEGALALYVGHLYGWKGRDTLLEAAHALPADAGITLVFVGGTPQDVAEVRAATKGLSTVLVLGHKPKADIPRYLCAADVLLLPNTAQSIESQRYTSPLKLFEYLASGTPIVASDLPSVREVLSESTARLVPPDDAQALVAAVRDIVERGAADQARQALLESKRYSWRAHAEHVAEFIRSVARA